MIITSRPEPEEASPAGYIIQGLLNAGLDESLVPIITNVLIQDNTAIVEHLLLMNGHVVVDLAGDPVLGCVELDLV